MAGKRMKMDSSFSDVSDYSVEDLKELNVKIRAELDASRNTARLLRREKTFELKQLKEQEQTRLNIAIKDLRAKLHQEKTRELEAQKDGLNRKHDFELQKLAKQRDAEVRKLRGDLMKCQSELAEMTQKGLSVTARGSFEAERARLTKEVFELRGAKRQLEESIQALRDADRKKAFLLRSAGRQSGKEAAKAKKDADADLAKVKKEAEVEMAKAKREFEAQLAKAKADFDSELAKVAADEDMKNKKLLDEITSKDRLIAELREDLGSPASHFSKKNAEQVAVAEGAMRNLTKTPPQSSQDGATMPASQLECEDDDRFQLEEKIAELEVKVFELEEKSDGLTQDKGDLMLRLQEVEGKQRPLLDKNKKFLEKNMELTSINRDLEEKIRTITDENNKLTSQIEHMKGMAEQMSTELTDEQREQMSTDLMRTELIYAQEKIVEQDKTIMALKMACVEKDRRLELISHRRRKQRANKVQQKVVRFLLPAKSPDSASGLKETFFGYEEDHSSVDSSEMSSSSRLSSSHMSLDNDVFDEFTREEFERNYQRLAREHLDLEKSFALLQAQGGSTSQTDPQREQKDTGWMDEKENLQRTIRKLKEKLREEDETNDHLKQKIQEAQEQNEELEFRVLELEEANEKLTEDAENVAMFKKPPKLTDQGVLQMYAQERGILEIKMEELKERLHELKYNQDGHLSHEEKLVLLQARAMLDIAEKKLRDLQASENTLNKKVRILEEEKAELLSAATGVSTDIILEYEDTVNKLTKAEETIQQLEADITAFKAEAEELNKAIAIHKYTEAHQTKIESQYKDEISNLRRQLSSNSEGREYESQLVVEKAELLLEKEQKLVEFALTAKALEESLASVQKENEELAEQLRHHQETASLTESEQDASNQLHTLRSKLLLLEKSEVEFMEKNEALQAEVSALRDRLKEYEVNEAKFTEENVRLSESLSNMREKCHKMEEDMGSDKEELESIKEKYNKICAKSYSSHDAQTDDEITQFNVPNPKDLLVDNEKLREEVANLQEELKLKDIEITKHKQRPKDQEEFDNVLSRMEQDMADLEHQNTTLKYELKEKVMRLEKVEYEFSRNREDTDTLEMIVLQLRTENAQLVEKINESLGETDDGAITLRDRLIILEEAEKALKDHVQEVETAKRKLEKELESYVGKAEEYTAEISHLRRKEDSLEEDLQQYEEEVDTLKRKLKDLEAAQHASEERVLDLEGEKALLQSRVSDLEAAQAELKELKRLRENVTELESARKELEKRVLELQALADAESSKAQRFEKITHELETAKQLLQDKIIELQEKVESLQVSGSNVKDVENRITQLEEAKSSLNEKVTKLESQVQEAKAAEIKAKDQLALMDEEKTRRIEVLEIQLEKMEENENRLTESIRELEGVEQDLKTQVAEREKLMEDSKKMHEYEAELFTLRESQEFLQTKVAELQSIPREELKLNLDVDKTPEKAKDEEDGSEYFTDEEVDGEEDADKKYIKKIKEMKQKIAKLVDREAQLMEEAYQMQLDKQELQDHIDELIGDGEWSVGSSQRSPRGQGQSDHLKERLEELERENNSLKDDLLKVKLESIGTLKEPEILKMADGLDSKSVKDLQDRINELERSEADLKEKLEFFREFEDRMKHMEEAEKEVENKMADLSMIEDRLKEMETHANTLEEELAAKEKSEYELSEKVDLLQQSGEKLLEQLEIVESKEKAANVEIEELKKSKLKSEEDLKEQISTLEKEAKHMREAIVELEGQKIELTELLEDVKKDENKELEQLREKVDILLDTEERLIDRLQEQEDSEAKIREELRVSEKTCNELEEKVMQYEKQRKAQAEAQVDTESALKRVTELENNETVLMIRLSDAEKAEADMTTQVKGLNTTTEQLKKSEQILQDRLADADKAEAVLKTQLEGLNTTVEQLKKSEKTLQERVAEFQQADALWKNKVGEMEKEQIVLHTKVNSLESQNTQLFGVVKTKQENGGQTHIHVTESPLAVDENLLKSIEEQIQVRSQSSSPPRLSPTPSPPQQRLSPAREPSPVRSIKSELSHIHGMSRAEMVSRIHELEQMENFHRVKIRELTNNLTQFRQAVENVAVHIETDTNIPTVKQRPSTKDSEYEARVQALVKSEVTLKLRVLEYENECASLRNQLKDAQMKLKDVEADYREEIEELEEELDKLRKSEARLKNKVQYGQLGDHENQSLSKIQHLESLVFDLEASERKLKRRVQELQNSEEELREKLTEAENVQSGQTFSGVLKDLEEKDKYYELLSELKILESTDRDLKEKLTELEKQDTSNLLRKIANLERSERGLKRKVELLESQEMGLYKGDTMLDTPEAVLRSRIRELEKMERHLKQQVVELERDREELHDIARKDKSLIHELNVQVRELQLSEKNLKDAVNRGDVQETHLQMKIDDLTDRIQELEEMLKKTQTSERSLRAQLHKFQFSESDLSIRLENTVEDFQATEQRFKKKINDMEKDKRDLVDKIDELMDRVSDLENIEMSLKQKLKNYENHEVSLQSSVAQLEQAESSAKLRAIELESLNENLSQKIHKLEEEKSGLMYDMSELEVTKDELTREVNRLNLQVKQFQEKLDDQQGNQTQLQSRMQDMTNKEGDLLSRVEEYERSEKIWHERVTGLERSERKLKQKIQELEANMSTAKTSPEKAAELEKECSMLRIQLDLQRKGLQRLEDDNHALTNKLREYENAADNNQLASIPKQEVQQLRARATQLTEMEKNIQLLEKSERNLRDTIAKLREGKDVCGHEDEIKDLKDKLNKHTTITQAHELLKNNHEETKQELKQLKQKLQNGEVSSKKTSSKCIQVRLADSLTLKDLTPELRQALKNLGARHPQAYQEFLQTLQPSGQSATTMTANRLKMKLTPEDSIQEEAIMPQQSSSLNASKGESQSGDRVQPPSEDPLWHTVEARKTHPHSRQNEESFWANIERSGELDDMTVSLNFGDELDNTSESDGAGRRRTDSEGSLPPPPLPNTLPPPQHRRNAPSPSAESYYLPSSQADGAESADEASEIVDEEVPPHRRKMRAKSADRDSDYSEGGSLSVPYSPQTRRRGKVLTGSLDSIPDSGMETMHQTRAEMLQEKIHNLEKDIKTKDKELDLALLNLKEMEKKAKDAEEVFTLRAKLKDRERQLDVEKKEGSDKKVQVEDMRRRLTETEGDAQQLRNELARLHSLLRARHNEVDRITQELRQWQENSRSAKEEKERTETLLRQAQRDLETVKDSGNKFNELQQNYTKLQKEHEELVAVHQQLESAAEEKQTLEKIVLKLRGQLKDLERIDLERDDLSKKVKAMKEELKNTKQTEGELTKDNARTRQLIDTLKKENGQLRAMEMDYHKVRSKFDEMERKKTKAETMVTPLRARVIRLAQQCRNKDDLIARLVKELRHYGEPSDLLAEADRVQAQSTSEEYNRPLSPLNQHHETFEDASTSEVSYPSKQSMFTSRRGPTSSTEELNDSSQEMDEIQAFLDHSLSSENGDSSDNNTFPRRQHKNGASQPRPRSMDVAMLGHRNGNLTIDDIVLSPPHMSLQAVSRLNGEEHTPVPTPRRKVRDRGDVSHHSSDSSIVASATTNTYKAIKDYEPEHFSRSGHKRLELPLKEGDVVKVLGAKDERGYYEAEVKGSIGLVPANYLQPVYQAAQQGVPTRRRHRMVTSHADTSPEKILEMHQQLQQSHTPLHKVSHSGDVTPRSRPHSAIGLPHSTIHHPAFARSSYQSVLPPVIPIRRTTSRSTRPSSHGPNASTLPRHTSSTHSRTDVSVHSSLQNVAQPTNAGVAEEFPAQVEGPPEPPSHFQVARMLGNHSVLLSWDPPAMDELGHSNGTVVRGYRIYINNRDKQIINSAYLTKALIEKLSLRRPHRFSIQTLAENGHVSRMVECNFDDVQAESPHGAAGGESTGDADISSVLSSQADDGERRVFMAVYDYIPSEHSPNQFPDQEITLKTGDIITTYGNVRPDGFYHAKAHGRKCLVPANFIQEVALLRSHSKRLRNLRKNIRKVLPNKPVMKKNMCKTS